MLGGGCEVRGSNDCHQARETQICRLGWLLLMMWLCMIIYMTKEMWCGSIPMETPREEKQSTQRSSTKYNNHRVIEV
ncbi:unnamed protein product, partial [Mesorhabditis belari]|uniref:Uncharacterized protein n=1 Tax=Mesorhabditis belari TaxID=2138241 RepID=A0AAF3FI19_9BILA